VGKPSDDIHDSQQWRRRGEEARAVAVHINDLGNRLALLKVAEACERMANWIEQRAGKADDAS
jgi:hypothetical protein